MALPSVETISKEMIKPSRPTPIHHRNHNLSFIDQIQPPIHIPLVFFYQNKANGLNTDHDHQLETCLRLKQSLSSALTIFYPLAGRIHGNSSIDCNDEGAEFMEARVNACLDQVIKDPKMEELEQFLPVNAFGLHNMMMNVLLSVKISFFDCGGIALAVCVSHIIADGPSLMTFINAWAAENNSDGLGFNIIDPSFDLGAHFPPKDLSGSSVKPITNIRKEKVTTRRLIFGKEKIQKLKHSISLISNGQLDNPTRVEAVSSFLWQRFIQANKTKTNVMKTLSAAVHAVDFRPRTNPPLSENAFGNCCGPTIAEFSETDVDENAPSIGDGSWELVNKLRESVRRIDGDYIKEVQNGKHLDDHSSKIVDLFKRGGKIVGFTSWCRFGVYEVDFGWGKPVWVCTTTMPFKSLVVLMNTPSGDGIEAWVNLAEDDVETHRCLCDDT